jgi:hypothetical protein
MVQAILGYALEWTRLERAMARERGRGGKGRSLGEALEDFGGISKQGRTWYRGM